MMEGAEKEDGETASKSFPSSSKSISENSSSDSLSDSEDTFEAVEKKLFKQLNEKLKIQDDISQFELNNLNIEMVAKYIKSKPCNNIVFMVGAGISTAAGIPDFRSPETGIYSNLGKYNLPSPDCMFHAAYFKKNPEPFYQFVKDFLPTNWKPTLCHYFLKLLIEKGMVLRVYTQNIDALERLAGISEDKLVEAHGTFCVSHCTNHKCMQKYDLEWMKEYLQTGTVPFCSKCDSVVKPDIVFFGEYLPSRFEDLTSKDFKQCDLLIVIGTSLMVQPFASLVDLVKSSVPRLFINKTKCCEDTYVSSSRKYPSELNFDLGSPKCNISYVGLCDDGCKSLAKALGFETELMELYNSEHEKLEGASTLLLIANSCRKDKHGTCD